MPSAKRRPKTPKPRQTATGGAVIDACLAKVPPEHRAVIERLRRTIRAAAPRAVEALSYGVPSVRHDGRGVVAYAAAARHGSLYPMSSAVFHAFAADLRGYDCSKGTIRFPYDAPPPAALVRRIVKARLAEVAERSARR